MGENMDNTTLIAVIVTVLFIYALYWKIIVLRNKVKESIAGIDVQLKKRYDLIPNMLNMAAKFMEHEKNLMNELTNLRTKAMSSSFEKSPKEKMELESMLNHKLSEFKVSMENYPDLKSNQTMITAMQSMNEVEEHIAAARRFYNSNVTSLRNMVDIFPLNIIASMAGISSDTYPFFEADENERKSIDSRDYFK